MANPKTVKKTDLTYGQPLGNRRLRQSNHIRELVREVLVDYRQMIQPLFVVEEIAVKESIPGIPGTYRDTPTSLLEQVAADLKNGVTKFILFGVPKNKKTADFDTSFTVSQIKALKEKFGDQIWLAVDVCLCASTLHGHCGILNDCGDHVLNPDSTHALAEVAAAYAKAGADCVAPSDMMDGRIAAIRSALDDAELDQVMIMSYSAKFASNFYGPFRVACDSAPDKTIKLTDRKTYQLDYARPQDGYLCSIRDWEEGADILMVKPVVNYLDIMYRLTQDIPLPFAAYHVSGEHASIEASAEKGLIDPAKGHVEVWHAIKRAGASIIITYAARYAKDWLQKYA